MQIVDKDGNIFGGGLQVNGPDGKPKTIGGGPPTGAAGGDLSGFYPNPGVVWSNGLPTYDLQYYPLTNPSGFITSATAAATYQPLLTLTTTGTSGAATLTGSTLNIPQYGGSSSLTVGTTAIASGTIGGVLFQGTGNVLQQSANLFWDNTNNRLGIGTSTPTKTFDLRGDANIISADNLGGNTLSVFANNLTQGIGISYNTISLIGSSSNINLTLSPKGTGMLLITSSITQVNNLGQVYAFGNSINGNYGTNANSSLILNYSGASAGTTHFRDTLIYNGKAAQIAQFTGSTGNFLINTTTDTGFKLNVNGTARVSGNLTLTGGSLLMNNNNIYIARGTGTPTDGMEIRALSAGTDAVKVTTSSVSISSVGGLTYQASAQLAVDSTTRGFLPPRMTTTQKNAIASPAAGLVVYDTTLNKLCVRTASAWETITSV